MSQHRNCPHCDTDLRGVPMKEEYFLHNTEANLHWDRNTDRSCEEQVEKWGRCHCLPYGDRDPEDRFFWRTIMMEIPGVYDGGLYYICPDCGWTWDRWKSGPLHDLGRKYIHDSNRRMMKRDPICYGCRIRHPRDKHDLRDLFKFYGQRFADALSEVQGMEDVGFVRVPPSSEDVKGALLLMGD